MPVYHLMRWQSLVKSVPTSRLTLWFPQFVFERWNIQTGQTIENWNADLIGTMISGNVGDDMPIGDWPIVSLRFRELLSQFSSGTQFLPIQIRNLVGDTITRDYSILNSCPLLDCLALKQSTFRQHDKSRDDSGEYFNLRLPAIKASKARDCAMFRIKRASKHVIVRDEVRLAAEEAAISGCSFFPMKR